MRPFIKQEIKQYIKHLHSPIISFGDSSLTLITKAVNIIAENNPSVQCMADVEDVDVQILYETLESENTANNGKSIICLKNTVLSILKNIQKIQLSFRM